MPGKFKKVRCVEVSPVDKPANELAEIPVAKAADDPFEAAKQRFRRRVDKRLKREKKLFNAELKAIERGEPVPIEKKRKKKKTTMAFTEELTNPTEGPQGWVGSRPPQDDYEGDNSNATSPPRFRAPRAVDNMRDYNSGSRPGAFGQAPQQYSPTRRPAAATRRGPADLPPASLPSARSKRAEAVTDGAVMKRAASPTEALRTAAAVAHEARLQKAVDRECSRIVAKGSTGDEWAAKRAEHQDYRERLFAKNSDVPGQSISGGVRAPVRVNKAYQTLMAKAAELADSDPQGRTQAQWFAKLYESKDSNIRALVAKARAPMNSDEIDDDDVEASAGDGDFDEGSVTDPDDDLIDRKAAAPTRQIGRIGRDPC